MARQPGGKSGSGVGAVGAEDAMQNTRPLYSFWHKSLPLFNDFLRKEGGIPWQKSDGIGSFQMFMEQSDG